MSYSGFALCRRFISRSMASRIMSRRGSPSDKTASILAVVPSANGKRNCSVHSFLRPTLPPLGWRRLYPRPSATSFCAVRTAELATAGVAANHSPRTLQSRNIQWAWRSIANAVERGKGNAKKSSRPLRLATWRTDKRLATSFVTPTFWGPSAVPMTYTNELTSIKLAPFRVHGIDLYQEHDTVVKQEHDWRRKWQPPN